MHKESTCHLSSAQQQFCSIERSIIYNLLCRYAGAGATKDTRSSSAFLSALCSLPTLPFLALLSAQFLLSGFTLYQPFVLYAPCFRVIYISTKLWSLLTRASSTFGLPFAQPKTGESQPTSQASRTPSSIQRSKGGTSDTSPSGSVDRRFMTHTTNSITRDDSRKSTIDDTSLPINPFGLTIELTLSAKRGGGALRPETRTATMGSRLHTLAEVIP
jgi:hypothetical protein